MDIFEFEKKYKDVLENIEEWGYIRVPFANYLRDAKSGGNVSGKNSFFSRLKKIYNIFYGFSHWFRHYEGLVFSDSSERRWLNSRYFDKISDDVIDRLDSDRTLMIELPSPSHYSKDTTYTKHIVSESLPKIMIYIIKKIFTRNKEEIKGLSDIFERENIAYDYKEAVAYFKSNYIVYKSILKLLKPKYIFVNCHYCRFGLIKAANDLEIPVIELQHGVINRAHYAYVSDIRLRKKFFPQTLLSFGERERYLKNRIIEEVYPIGSFYLEYITKHFEPSRNLLAYRKSYKLIVGISMQDQKEWEIDEIFRFIVSCAKKDSEILYIMIPRRVRQFKMQIPKNMIIFDQLDCYHTLLHCNVHATLYSSCALEAPTLGIPNILIDVKGYATEYYQNILDDMHTKIVTNEKDFFNALSYLAELNKEVIKEHNSNIFLENYIEHMNKFVTKFKKV